MVAVGLLALWWEILRSMSVCVGECLGILRFFIEHNRFSCDINLRDGTGSVVICAQRVASRRYRHHRIRASGYSLRRGRERRL